MALDHKVHVYLEYHSVCPLVGIGTPSTPSSPLASGVEGVSIRTTGEKTYSTLSIPCALDIEVQYLQTGSCVSTVKNVENIKPVNSLLVTVRIRPGEVKINNVYNGLRHSSTVSSRTGSRQ